MALFSPKVNIVSKHTREPMRITEEHIDSIFKWVTPRDIQMLEALLHHPFLTVEQIEMMFFSDLKPSSWRNKANERLRKLYHAHCIDRFFPPVQKEGGSSSQHVLLDYAGAKVLARHYGRTKKFKWRKRAYIPQTYAHITRINDFKALLYLLSRQLGVVDNHPIGEIILWQQEKAYRYIHAHDGRATKKTIIPDAFCVYKYNAKGNVKVFFLECDNSTEPIETLTRKILNYHQYFRSGYWKEERWAQILKTFPTTLFLLDQEESVKECVRYASKLRSPVRFLFTTYSNLYEDTYKEYVNKHGKRRLVLQERKIKILDEIWHSANGLVSL